MHTNQIVSKILPSLILLFLSVSCAEKEEVSYVVKVGNTYLTEENINESLGHRSNSHKFREEYIREWIEKELIFLDAQKTGILNSKEYIRLVLNSKIEIANALAVKKMIADSISKITKKQLEDYYVNNVNQFRISTPLLIFNQVSFTDRDTASEFLKQVINSDWETALNEFYARGSKMSVKSNRTEYVYNILQESLLEEFEMLSEYQFSRIVEVSENAFVIVQLIKRYNKNDVPEFEEITEEIEHRYLSLRRKDIYDNYLNKLFSEYSSGIER